MASESGAALLAALFIVALLTYLVIEFNYTSRVDLNIASRYRDLAEARAIAKAGVAETIALLREDFEKDKAEAEVEEETEGEKSSAEETELKRVDHLGEDWAAAKIREAYGRGTLSFMVYDEGSRININSLFVESAQSKLEKDIKKSTEKETEEEEEEKEKEKEEEEDKDKDEGGAGSTLDKKVRDRLERILEVLDMEDVDEEEVLEAIEDWIDEDDEGDVEESYYADMDEPCVPANRSLNTVDEILLIKGITPDLFYGPGRYAADDIFGDDDEDGDEEGTVGLRDCLTVYGDSKFNVNTAGAEVMRSYLTEDEEDLIEEIMDDRLDDYFEDKDDFEEAMGSGIPGKFMDAIAFSSSIFRIISEGEVNGTKIRVNAVVERDDKGNVTFLYWRWEDV